MNEKCIIFGCGSVGERTYYSLNTIYEILAFSDNNSDKWGHDFLGLKIINPDEIRKTGCKVVVASVYHDDICRQLYRLGVRQIEYIDRNTNLLTVYDTKENYCNSNAKDNKNRLKKVLFVQRCPCIRTYKISCMLADAGIKVDLAYMKKDPRKNFGDMRMPWGKLINIISLEHFIEFVDNSDYDLIHHSNEPDALADLLLHSKKKLVHDVHDLMSIRNELSLAETVQEYIVNRYSDGIIYVSESSRREAFLKYKNEQKKTFVLENYIYGSTQLNERHEKLRDRDGKIHCVYEGGISSEKWHHRYYEEIFTRLAEAGAEVHFYTSQPDVEYYHKLESLHESIHFEGSRTHEDLLCELTMYDVGLLMFNVTRENFKQMYTGSPNKMYDYLQAGLPVAAQDMEHCIRFLEKHQVGGRLEWDDNILEQLTLIARLKVSDSFLIDNNLVMQQKTDELIEFYENIAFDY